TPAEQHQILVDWNQTQRPYGFGETDEILTIQSFHQLFETQVEQTPESVALIFDRLSLDSGAPQRLTYAELNQRSNQLAHYLQSSGVKPETIVGICLERSPEQIIAMLAVLKAGGAYLPLDPAYPADRLNWMLTDSQASILITQPEIDQLAIPEQTQRLELGAATADIQNYPATNPVSGITSENLAYLIYTSGSTGKPKGVLIPHGGLVNLTEDKLRVCDVRSGDCILQFFSFSFDASIPEIIMALATGSSLLLAPSADLMPGPGLAELLRRNRVTHMTITPSALVSVPSDNLPDLRMVLVGGEAPSPELIATWSPGRKFINAYGPTETTVNASMVPCGNGQPIQPTLLPSTNKQLYILDENLQLLPIGAIGELYIGGVGLARGYLHRPELTAERFIPNPFVDRSLQFPNTLLYKTGDLACYRPDGRIKILGRVDFQTKIRGFRIEPGEIEQSLTQHPDVKASVVLVREDTPGERRLAAYVVPQTFPEDTLAFSRSLRRFLSEKLPHYMVPAVFVCLEALPLTPNGKVDTRALPNPTLVEPQSTAPAPRSPLETNLTEIFAAVLGVEQVGIHADFFELGGHSLLATQLVARLLDQFDVAITVVDLFEATTVADLADRIQQKQLIQQLQQPVPAMQAEQDTLDASEREEFAL
ncbi:MAG: amino acid adenylation domain-containing protein, partial [Cyanobacteria bacterium P01_H01_bin.121]